MFWKLRIVEILPNRKSIKIDSTLCIPLKDYALCLPSGPCHSSCHCLDIASCYRALQRPGQLYSKGKYFCLCQNIIGEWGEKSLVYLFHCGSVGLEKMSIFNSLFIMNQTSCFPSAVLSHELRKLEGAKKGYMEQDICFSFYKRNAFLM